MGEGGTIRAPPSEKACLDRDERNSDPKNFIGKLVRGIPVKRNSYNVRAWICLQFRNKIQAVRCRLEMD